ncbi:MAG: AAA family ATPase [Rhodospirillaceae bacterium]|nr:AAA family ATPase [Rhodospirillaceae bacterium]MDE0253517.1 AAA family ATPase [Rhodospirillaceae bacterium]MDE0616197.1 AAA family ATPase [Rhodospirillaceae bacterium]
MNEVQLPTYEEIARDERQLGVLETPFKESLFVVGPPGSGKTVLAVQRAQMLADAGNSAVLITFNRMLRRLIAQLTEGRVNARTMHRFVSRHYRRQTASPVPSRKGDDYDYIWDGMFSKLQERGVTPGPVHTIVDEAQDLPRSFFRYLRDFVANTVTVFADEDQALRADRSTLRDIKVAGRFGDPILLTANHRNTPEIARVAEFFHAGDAPVPEVKRRPSGELPRLVAYRMGSATELIANWYSTRGGRVGVAVVRNPTGKDLYSRLRARLAGQRVQSYTNERKNENEIDLLAPGITILNVNSIKGQEFDTVFVMEIGVLLRRASEVNNRKMYMLCARARDNLFLMHEGDHLPAALLERLPGADILERP